MQLTLDSLEKVISADPTLKAGCIVDTNVIFAASYPLDHHNEWAEEVTQILAQFGIPLFTNMNIRSEFIDLSRRILIAEGLVDFYEDFKGLVRGEVDASLKSLKTRKTKAHENNKTFILNDSDIKHYRGLLETIQLPQLGNAWDSFCENYIHPYLKGLWDEVTNGLKLNFLGAKEIEEQKFFTSRPKWDEMVNIVGKTGIGSSDAMIINLFLQSTIPLIITADNDVKKTVMKLSPQDKLVLAP